MKMGKKIKLVLLENVAGMGNAGTIVEVSHAYARNVLIPKNQAKIADAHTIKQVQANADKKAKENEKQAEAVQAFFDSLSDKPIVIKKKATTKDNLYSKIDAKELAETVNQEFNLNLPKDAFKLKGKIDALGEYDVDFDYAGMSKTITVKVEKEE